MNKRTGSFAWATALALAILLALPAARAQDGTIEEVIPAPEIGRYGGADLGQATWRVNGGDGAAMARPDFDDSTWVARGAVSVDLLRNPVAWYRINFVLEAGTVGMAGRLELGGVEGNVSVYLNGVQVGEMRGEVDPPYERRDYITLPAKLLDPDRNVLALRLAGFAGRPKVGFPRGPIRLHPLSPTYERQDQDKQLVASADRRIVMAALQQATGSVPFGRFGRQHSEGLLTCQLTPSGFLSASSSLDPTPVSGVFGSPGPKDAVILEYLSPVGKIIRVEQTSGSKYRLYYPLMYPGFAIEPLGAPLAVRLSSRFDALWVDRWGIASGSAKGETSIPWTEPWAVLFDPAGLHSPLMVGLSTPRYPLSLVRATDSLEVAIPAGKVARFNWPKGISLWKPSQSEADLARFRFWGRAMVPFGLDRTQRVAGDRLFSTDRFEYLQAGATPYAPLPPVLALFTDATPSQTVRAPKTSDLGVSTLAGPLRARVSASEIAYDIALPELGIPISPHVDGAPTVALGDLPDAQAGNAMDLAFTKRVSALLRWPNLGNTQRDTLAANGRKYLPQAWSPLAWTHSLEPLSGTVYAWTWGRFSPAIGLHSFGLANGLALHGTAVASLFSGDWSVPQGRWAGMVRAFDWFEQSFDWAWQAPSDADAGDSTGSGESLSAAYLGALAMARMSAVVAPASHPRYVSFAARMAPLVKQRGRLTDYARSNGLLPARFLAMGLNETGIVPASASLELVGRLNGEPDLAHLPVAPFIPLDWAPARLDEAVYRAKTRVLEVRYTLKQIADGFDLRIWCAGRPKEVSFDGTTVTTWTFDPATGVMALSPPRGVGTHTLTLRH